MKFDFHALLPLVGAILPLVKGGDKAAALVPTIAHAIETAEQHGGTGAEKKARAKAIVQDAITVANATGKVHLDPTAVDQTLDNGIDAVVGAVNIAHGATLHKVQPPTP
jgi:hypothetical protein